MEQIKCVVIGAAKSGKRSLIIRYVDDSFTTKRLNSVTNSWVKSKSVGETPVFLGIWDTQQGEELDNLQREILVPSTNVYIICVSLESGGDLASILEELQFSTLLNNTSIPLLLVGTKSDLMESELEIGAEGPEFLQCSALSGEGVGKVFERAMELGLEHCLRKKRKVEKRKKTCSIL